MDSPKAARTWSTSFMSRVGLILKVIGWDDIELICRFGREFLFLSLQASCLCWLYNAVIILLSVIQHIMNR